MKDSDFDTILKKNNLELQVFVDARPMIRRFFKLSDLRMAVSSGLDHWKGIGDFLPNSGLVVQSYRTIEALITTLAGSETVDIISARTFVDDLRRESFSRPLLSFDRNPLPNLAKLQGISKDWLSIVIQKLAAPDNFDISGHDYRIRDLYYQVVAQISFDGTTKKEELDRSIEWGKEFRASVMTFLESREQEYRAAETEHKRLVDESIKVHQTAMNDFRSEHDGIFKHIEKTYEEKVRIAEPAKLWDKKHSEYRKQGQNWFYVSLGLGLVICAVGFCFFLFFPTIIENKANGSSDYTGSFKWLLLVGVGIGALIFLLRQAVKLSLSSFHMSRDAEEKAALTSFYLSLISNKALDPEKEIEIRTIIMNSLFARTETGLLRGESSPTMPNGGISEIARLVGGKT